MSKTPTPTECADFFRQIVATAQFTGNKSIEDRATKSLNDIIYRNFFGRLFN